MKLTKIEISILLYMINMLDIHITDDHRAEMKEYVSVKDVKEFEDILNRMKEALDEST